MEIKFLPCQNCIQFKYLKFLWWEMRLYSFKVKFSRFHQITYFFSGCGSNSSLFLNANKLFSFMSCVDISANPSAFKTPA